MNLLNQIELENVQTWEKYFHEIGNQSIDYSYILNTILLYEPQCQGQTLSIMYYELQKQSWIFMSSNFSFDIKNSFNQIQKEGQKNKISRVMSSSKITNKSSHIQSSSLNTNVVSKGKSILKIRFHCQTWLDQQTQIQKFALHNYYSTSSLEGNSEQDKLVKKINQLKQKIKQMQKISYQLQDQFQSEPLDINLYWACPLFATDGVKRKPQKGKRNKKGYKPFQSNKIGIPQPLKHQIKYGVYLNPIIEQIKNSNKKVLLQVDLFNKKTFQQKNIFKIVYLICHTEPIMNQQKELIELQAVQENQQQKQSQFEMPLKKTQSQIVEQKSQQNSSENQQQTQTKEKSDMFDELQDVQQESFNQSRKQSINSIQEAKQVTIQEWPLDQNGYFSNQVSQKGLSSKQTSKKKFQFRQYKEEQLKLKNSRQKQIKIQFSNNNPQQKGRKHWSKEQKRAYKKQKNVFNQENFKFKDKKGENNKYKKQKKHSQTLYFIGQNKHGQLQKVSPSQLDQMLSKDKKQNIQLFILHTSFPYAHLPVLQKHSNNVLLINSNPLNPQPCTIFFLQRFFKYLLEKKQIKTAYQQAFNQTSSIFQQKKQENQLFKENNSNLQGQQSKNFQQVNKKQKSGVPFTCCCYHKHQPWCQFRNTMSTSKYSDCHYKYHIHRCECDIHDLMVHHCDEKKKDMRTFGIISKDYHQKKYYFCCCQGHALKKYPKGRYNSENYLSNCELVDDIHSMKHKFLLKKNIQLSFNKQKSIEIQTTFNISDGEPQGDIDKRFLDSFKFLSQNTLVGNKQLIVDMMSFFTNYDQFQEFQLPTLDMKKSQSFKDQMRQSQRVNSILAGSLLRQNQQSIGSRFKYNNNYVNQRKIFNIFGQGSTGRKKISIFLANMLVIKQIFPRYMIKEFYNMEDIKYLQTNKEKPIFYILIYKHEKTQNGSNIKSLFFKSSQLPQLINAIVITTKKITYDQTIKVICKSPQAFDKFQTMSYIKIYKHLSNDYKKKLQKFMDLTYNQLSQNVNDKIYPNNLDPNQVICMLNKSHYQFSQGYLNSLLKISQENLPKYIFIMSIIFQTIKEENNSQSKDFKKKIKSEIKTKLSKLMEQKQGFFKQSLNSQNTRLEKKKRKEENLRKRKQNRKIFDECQQAEEQTIIQKQKINKKFDSEDMKKVIDIDMVLMYFPLVFQKLRSQVKKNTVQLLKMYIHYSTLNFNSSISIKETFEKAKLNQLQKQNSLKSPQYNYRTRLINYEPQFYEVTTLNTKSFIHHILKRQMIQSQHYYVQKEKFRNTTQSIPSLYEKQKFNKEEHSVNQFVIFHGEIIKSYFTKQKQSKLFSYYYQNQKFDLFSSRQSGMNSKSKNDNLAYSNRSIASESKSFQNEGFTAQRLKYFQHIKHIKYVIQAGLNFVRNILSSHLIYNKFELKEKIHILSFSLLLINNAIIFMKNPYWNVKIKGYNEDSNESEQSMISLIDSTQLNQSFQIDDNKFQQNAQKVNNAENIKTSKQIKGKLKKASSIQTDLHLIQRHFSTTQKFMNKQNKKSKDKDNKKQSKSKKQTKNQKNNINTKAQQKNIYIQEDIFFQSILSSKGLIYLLAKINFRCNSLIIDLTNNPQNTIKKQIQIQNLSILADLLSLQVHIDTIFVTQKIIQQNYVKKQTPFEKLLNIMFNDQGRKFKEIQQKIKITQHSYEDSVTLQDHLISSYILLITRCGRIKITQSMANDILKIKNNMDEKINKVFNQQTYIVQQRRGSINDDNIIQKAQLNSKKNQFYGRLKILHRICQNQKVFNKINVPFNVYQIQNNMRSEMQKNQLKPVQMYQSLRYHPHSLTKDNSKSPLHHNLSANKDSQNSDKQKQSLNSKCFNKQNNLDESSTFDNLLKKYHMFEKTLNLGCSQTTYEVATQLYQELTSHIMTHSLIYCSRYIHDFKKDFKNKVANQLNSLKEKLFVVLQAHPLQYGRQSKLHGTDSKVSGSLNQSKISYNIFQSSTHQDQLTKKKINQQNLKKTAILSQLSFLSNDDFQIKNLQKSISLKNSLSIDSLTLKSPQKSSFSDGRQNPQKTSIVSRNEKIKYDNFCLKLKMNIQNLNRLKYCFGCKYLCINTSMAIDNQKEIIGEEETGQTIFFDKQKFISQLTQLSPPILFICLPKQKHLAQHLIKNRYKKQIVYFNFEDYKNNENEVVIRAYQRLIMLQAVKLIFQHMINNESQTLRLKNAFNHVVNSYSFSIIDETQKQVFNLSNQQLKKVTLMNCYKLDNEKVEHINCIKLSQSNIAFEKEISQVKKILEGRLLSFSDQKQKKIKKIQDISFQKFFSILKFYLKNKQNFQNFQIIDLEHFRRNKDKQIYDLGLSKLTQKSSSQSFGSIDLQKSPSGQSKKKKDSKKSKQSYCFSFEQTPVNLKWKSTLFKNLLEMNILDFYYSKRKGVIAFVNSQILTDDKYSSKQTWAKDMFMEMFNSEQDDSVLEFDRSKTVMKLQFNKYGDDLLKQNKHKMQVTLFFMQQKLRQN